VGRDETTPSDTESRHDEPDNAGPDRQEQAWQEAWPEQSDAQITPVEPASDVKGDDADKTAAEDPDEDSHTELVPPERASDLSNPTQRAIESIRASLRTHGTLRFANRSSTVACVISNER
jgi:hypothetical protein